MSPRAHSFVDAIAAYVPGEAALDGVAEPARLAANESAYGPSPAAVAAHEAAAAEFARYPDPDCAALRAAIGVRYGLDPARIVCGAGSDEMITLLCRAYAGPGDQVLHSRHGFLMYPIAAAGVGAEAVAAPETDLRADVDALLAAARPATKLCFLANPNNPTGSYLPAAEVERLRDGLPADCLLVLDAAYAEYVTVNDYDDGFRLATQRDDVVVTRTFSKIHALAALRVGWAYGPPQVVAALNKLRGPFNVAAPAQAAAAASIADVAHISAARTETIALRAKTAERLTALGFDVAPSVANFILVRCDDAVAAYDHLTAAGILVRRVKSYGLPDYLRIGIGRADEMDRLCDALARFVERDGG